MPRALDVRFSKRTDASGHCRGLSRPEAEKAAIVVGATKRRDVMPVISGFSELAGLPWERITDKIERRMLAGKTWHDRLVENEGRRTCHFAPPSARADCLDA